MNRTQEIMERRQIAALIDSDPVDLEILRSGQGEDGAGGHITLPEAILPAQRVTILPFKRRLSELLTNTELGDLAELPYVVVGLHTLDIQRDDEFFWQGNRFVVASIDLKRNVRVTAIVDYKGGPGNG